MSAVASITQEYRRLVPELLRRDRRTAKVIALRIGARPRTVEKWRDSESGPSVPHFIALAREIPELRQKVMEWLDAEQGGGTDPAKVLNDIHRMLEGIKGNG